MGPSTIPHSAERRSAADLQRILDAMIGDSGFVLAGDLPDVLSSYEAKHDLIILDPAEYEGLRALCGAHSEMELGPSELFQFLSMIQKPEHARYPLLNSSNKDSRPHIKDASDQSTPQPVRSARRRQSDRIRSPSDSSSTSSDGEEQIVRRKMDRQTSEPVGTKPFPVAPNALSGGSRPIPPARKKTLSDPSRLESPLSIRVKSGGHAPPSAFPDFARPSPASRRRKTSKGSSIGGYSDNDDSIIVNLRGFPRSVSHQSVVAAAISPPWPAHKSSSPASPLSPGIDRTSFHFRAKSPEEMAEEEILAAENDLNSADMDSVHDGEVDESEDIIGAGMLGVEALNPRLSRISTDSSASLRTSHDKLQMLQKQNSELSRKLKESKRQLSLLGADNDQMVTDLERQLEEARHELAQKRKEEKELRGNELKQNIQISGLEADLANVQRSLEQSKEHRANMQKMYDSQCDEAQRLRDLIRDRDLEIHRLEESLQEHDADESKYNRDIQSLEAEVKRLEADLVVARRAESVLETQKQENLQLKETIDRMRFDLDEARAAVNATKGGHVRSLTSASSAGGTLSRNLGDEISRRLMGEEAVAEEKDDEEEEDGFVETIVTTQRTRKFGQRKTAASRSAAESGGAVQAVDTTIVEYADAGVETDPVTVLPIPLAGSSTSPSSPPIPQDVPPAYSADPDPVHERQLLERTHPRTAGLDVGVDVEYAQLVKATGIRCQVLEDEIKSRKHERSKRALARKMSLYHKAIGDEYGVSDLVTRRYVPYVLGAFAVGLMAGSHLWGGSGVHPRDLQLWSTFNDLAISSGAGEGFLPQGSMGLVGMLGAGANMIGRVPT